MKNGSCDNVGSKRVIMRLFFYFTALFVILTASIFAFCACSDDASDNAENAENNTLITFVPNNGGDEIVRDINGNIPSLNKAGYYLSGWYADEGLTVKIEFDTLSDILNDGNASKFTDGKYKLYAKWQELKNLTGVRMKDTFFIYDGISHNPEIEGLPSGAEVIFSDDGERIDAGEYEVVATISKYGYNDLTLTAKVTIGKRKAGISGIKFEDSTFFWDGKEHSIAITGELPNGVSVSYENNAQKGLGVYDVIAKFDVGKNYESIADMTATLRIIAKEYKITFVEEDGSRRVVTVPAGESPTILTPNEKRGYLGKWSVDNFSGEHGDITAFARYELIRYGIEYDCNGGVLANDTVTEYTVSDRILLSESTRKHYEFCGWYEDVTCSGERVTEISAGSIGDRKFYAKWKAKTYAITFETSGGASNNGNTADGKYEYTVNSDDKVLLPAIRFGYEFIRWTDSDGNTVSTITADNPKDATLYAEWKLIIYKLEYELNGGNVVNNPAEYTVEDADIELANPTREKYIFQGWYETENFTGNEIRIIRTGECRDIKLYAKWEADIFRVKSISGKNMIVGYDRYFGDDLVVPAYVNGMKIDGITNGALDGAESVDIRAGIDEIDRYLFEGCSRLKRLILPSSLNVIPHGLLEDCVNLEYLSVPFAGDRRNSDDGVYYPLGSLFGTAENLDSYGVNVRLVYKSGNEFLYGDTYEDYKYYIPNSLREIRITDSDVLPYSMYGMKSVKVLVIESGENIGAFSLSGCSGLLSITMPKNLQEVKPSAFSGCVNLSEILISSCTDASILQTALSKLSQEVEIQIY